MGRVYVPDGSLPWAQRYAFPPTPYLLGDEVIRVYVAFCDAEMVGRVGYVDVDASNPSRVLRVSREPVLDIGEPGAFDENGVVPTCTLEVGGRLYMYYVGYQLGVAVVRVRVAVELPDGVGLQLARHRRSRTSGRGAAASHQLSSSA